MSSDKITDKDLSGPVVDRRTTLKLLGMTGAAGGLAGCTGGGGQDTPTEGGGGETEMQDGEETEMQEDTETPMSGSDRAGGRLKAGWFIGEITNLDPVLNSVGVMEMASMNLHNGLTRTTKKFKVVPEAAKDWTVKDKTEYTFELREGMMFHGDYGEVTADDVKFTIKRGLNLEGTTVKPKLNRIKPLDEGGVEVVDDYTVIIRLKEPFVPFIASAASRGGGAINIQSKAAKQDQGRDKAKVSPIGSGPFKVREHQIGSKLTLDAHEEYWETDGDGNPLPYLDGVDISMIPEAATMINALKSGDVQFVNSVPRENLSTVRQASGLKVRTAPAGGWIAALMNSNKEVFANKKARQAIAKLTDSKAFVEQAFFGENLPAVGPLGPVHAPHARPNEEKPDYQKFDREEGEKLLEESGMKGKSFSILTQKRDLRMAKVYKNMLGDYFDISIEAVDTSTYWTRWEATADDPFDLVLSGSDLDISPDTTTYFFFKGPDAGGEFNNTGYSNEKVNRLLEEQRQTFDTQKRAEKFHKAEDQIMKDAPAAFVYHTIPTMAHSEEVKNFTPHPFQRDLSPVYLDN